ncbi:MAG: tetratricopeptide repeat protein [Gammaproteobacteria bacterium]|nr:tetratricopeptide repeat protein [Gammaproteobacteria bacterium]MBT5204312.1 tetratricopeptide repeat protein [Gammaproteobacteria bacterium]MBT5602365.1 tetratricopeptide repeat protein [Gammaproteobacteria bacterium]MBT6246292.1 tetratricopeptide repeat protein [Gammaproteobacteria bacterium]
MSTETNSPRPESGLATQQAKALLEQGNSLAAINLLLPVLEQHPADREVLYLLAVCYRYNSDFAKAQDLLNHLKVQFPRYGRALQEEGHLLLAQNQSVAALAAFREAVTLNDSLVASWVCIAQLAEQLGQQPLGVEAADQVIKLKALPAALLAVRNLISEGQFLKAEKICRQFLLRYPKQVEAMRLLAALGVRSEVLDDADLLLENAVAFEPENEFARFDYMNVLYKRQKYQQALLQSEVLLKAQPDNPRFQTAYANQCVAVGRFEEALGIYTRLLNQAPNDATLHLLKGHALKTIDRSAEAIEAYRSAYLARPQFGDAFWSLANLKTYRFSADEVERMLEQEQSETIDELDRVNLCFALGKHYEDSAGFEQAFTFYERGNSLRKQHLGFDGKLLSSRMKLQKSVCKEALFKKHKDVGNKAADPIFIVGLPRAGSTLLEQILASHSQVDGTQELANIGAFAHQLDGRRTIHEEPQYPHCLATLSPQQFAEMGSRYLRDTQVLRDKAPYFIDKMPNNFRHIALIQLILPNSKIIDARRNPLACCFSGFKQFFSHGQEFTYGLEEIGRYYKDYIEIMDHWDQVLPGRILRVNHEDVVADLEGQVERMLSYCNLPFEQACVEFHKTQRSVRTPSSEQVRLPIYDTGLDAWRGFEPWLDPLKEMLGDDLLQGYV